MLIKRKEINETQGLEYIKSFNKFFIFVIFSVLILIIRVIGSDVLKYMDKESNSCFILIFITFILDILLFPVIVLIFCFKKYLSKLYSLVRKNLIIIIIQEY